MLEATRMAISCRPNTKVVVAVPWGQPIRLRRPVDYFPKTGKLRNEHFLTNKTARSASHIAFLGADVIDGTYRGDTPQLKFLQAASSAGLTSACLGFSFSSKAEVQSLARISRLKSTRFFVRDKPSLRRFAAMTQKPAELVADLAFLLEPELLAPSALEAADWIRQRRCGGGVVMALNLGGPGLAKFGDKSEKRLVKAIATWLNANGNRSLVLVPHDFRSKDEGDVDSLRRVQVALSAVARERIYFVEPPFDAWDAKAIAGEVDMAISSRMHFMIACLGMGTPCLGIAYQDKFEGMVEHFLLPDMMLRPEDDVLCRLLELEQDRAQLSQELASRLPDVQAMSRLNLDWIN